MIYPRTSKRLALALFGLCLFLLTSSSLALETTTGTMKVDRCLLKAYPDGPLSPNHFDFDCQQISGDDIKDGQILIQLLHISVDPYMRTRFQPGQGYIMPGFEIGQPIDSGCVAKVVESKHDDYPVGTLVAGHMPWETYQIVSDPTKLNKLPKIEGMPTTYFLGVMGLTGLSAYLPFQHMAKDFLLEKKDPVIFVSGSGGAVGSVFGQLCKTQIKGSTVFGSAGTPDKIHLCKSTLGFDDAFNYKDGIAKGLDALLQGKTIDLYFDNVGGEMLDLVLPRMSKGGKIICCGSISDYDKKDSDKYRLSNYFHIVTSCLTLQGFLMGQWADEIPQASQELGKLVAAGQLHPQETVLQGFDKVVEGLMGLFQGSNTGKMVISV